MIDLHKIRSDFITTAAPLVEQYAKAAIGEELLPADVDDTVRNETWSVLKTMLLKIEDRQAIDAQNTSQVLSLLKTGKVTVKEATELMALLNIKSEIDEVPKLTAALEKLGQ